MVKIYAVVLVLATIALMTWIATHVLAHGGEGERFDPEARLGIPGRRAVAGALGFALAGMSAEFSPRDLDWPLALGLAILGGTAMAWYAGRTATAGDSDGLDAPSSPVV